MLKDVLRDARNKKGLKQEDVAEKVHVAKQTYLKWENGATEPKASQILALSQVLDITPNEICKGQLNTRYSLEEYIYELMLVSPRGELETLKAWEHIPDHELYFQELASPTIEDSATEEYAYRVRKGI